MKQLPTVSGGIVSPVHIHSCRVTAPPCGTYMGHTTGSCNRVIQLHDHFVVDSGSHDGMIYNSPAARRLRQQSLESPIREGEGVELLRI